MSEYVIEKGIPMHGAGTAAETLKKMEVGDSIVVPNVNEKERFRSAARQLHMEIISRSIPEGGYRVWRSR